MSGGKRQTVGYKYAFGIHMGIGRGPLNVIKEVRVGDQRAWQGSVSNNTEIQINQPDLFGGDTKEGGVVGTLTVLMGAAGQTVAASIKSLMGGFVPNFVGVATLFYRGQIGSNNPYPKPWKFRVARWDAGWDRSVAWYSNKARVSLAGGQIDAMNPAHILYECYTNRLWGRGYDPSALHEPSWIAAANTLCDEGFGLCIRYNRQSDISEFINGILTTIGARVYPDPETGKIVLYLIRNNYLVDDLPTFDYDSGLLEATMDETGSETNFFSEVIVEYTDALTGEAATVSETNNALIQANGCIVSTTAQYPAIPTAALAQRVARRDLDQQLASKRMRLSFDRRAWRLTPGAPFKVSLPDRGISDLIMRVGDITDSEFTDGKIVVTAVQDFYGLPSTGYSDVVESAWLPAGSEPVPVTTAVVQDATYRDLALTQSNADLATLTDDVGFISIFAEQPIPTAVYYNLATAAAGETIAVRGRGEWTPSATISGALGAYDTLVSFEAGTDLSAAQPGEVAALGDELVEIVSVGIDSLTISRGCVDTVPRAHTSGTRIWLYEGLIGSDERDYALGETVESRLLTATQSRKLAIGSAAGIDHTITARQARPYPPGDLRVNGDPFAAPALAYTGAIALTWAHRNRVIQDDALVAHGEGSVTPEVGTTYNVRIFDGATLKRTATSISAAGWTYTTSMIAADGEPAALGWWFEVEAERNGLVSHQMYRFFVPRRAPISVTGSTGSVVVAGRIGTSTPRAVRVTGSTGTVIMES